MRLQQCFLLASTLLCVHLSAAESGVEAAFARFWAAKSPGEAAAVGDDVVRSGVTFDEAYRRLREGRPYAASQPGLVELTNETQKRVSHGFSVFVPASYDPHRKTPARIHLHGGVARPSPSRQAGPNEGSVFAEGAPDHIFILPQAWNQAPWWTEDQVDNVRGILDKVKRLYNIDENRVSVSGVSDGGTGAYYFAMLETSRFASFVPMIGMALVLANEQLGAEGTMFPNNLRNKPFFVVNGGLDPLYPTDHVDGYIKRFKEGGVEIDYRPQPASGHNVSWLPVLREPLEAFVRSHPRRPLPDRLTWQTTSIGSHNRAHWLVIDALGSAPGQAQSLDDVNLVALEPTADFGARAIGSRITQVVKGSNADQFGLKAFDTLVEVNGDTVKIASDLPTVLAQFKPGVELELLVARNGLPVELKGVYRPTFVPTPPAEFFSRRAPSGRVDLVRAGNTIDASTSGVTSFTLLLSPDQFDFERPVKVVANGRVVFDGRVAKSLAALLKWSAADNDRTMLFGAELRVDLTK